MPELSGSQYLIGQTGSRPAGFDSTESDFDIELLVSDEVFVRLCSRYQIPPSSRGVPIDDCAPELSNIDVAAHRLFDVETAIANWRDEAMWIWLHSLPIHDPDGMIAGIQESCRAYPLRILDAKLKSHYLRDFHLSMHGIPSHKDSGTLFSVVYSIAAKVAEYCRMCCLLDGIPFPYEKWLLSACENTTTGRVVAPFLRKAIATVVGLSGDLASNWSRVLEAVRLIDTEANDRLEAALLNWGVSAEWIAEAYNNVESEIFG